MNVGNVIGMRAAHPKTHPKSSKTTFMVSTTILHIILLFTIKISILFLDVPLSSEGFSSNSSLGIKNSSNLEAKKGPTYPVERTA
jgi:hypothetical protein